MSQAFRSDKPLPVGELDSAWAEAEAAAPDGWHVCAFRVGHPDVPEDAIAEAVGPYSETLRGRGDTPAAALRDLARRLREGER